MVAGWSNVEKIDIILEHLSSALAVVDSEGKILWLNREYAAYMKWEKSQALGQLIWQTVDFSLMRLVLTTGETITKVINQADRQLAVLEEKPLLVDGEIMGGISNIVSRKNRALNMLLDKVSVLEEELTYYQERLASKTTHTGHFHPFVSSNEKFREAVEMAKRTAKFDANILISGETGTGKGMMAEAIHYESPRKKHPLIKVNCAAIPPDLLESELFGYESGAFTGAKGGGKPGRFELADRGTIFLDEIGDMPMEMQAKLLRVIQDREIERLGGTKTIKIDVRVISATNKDLPQMVKQGTFREDLYYRLLVIGLDLPPLRERLEDLPYLINNILNRLCLRYDVAKPAIADRAYQVVKRYHWPGNVRELENILERALNLAGEGDIDCDHLPEKVLQHAGYTKLESLPPLTEVVAGSEIQYIEEVMHYAGGNKQKTAEILGLSRTALYKKLKKYNIEQKC